MRNQIDMIFLAVLTGLIYLLIRILIRETKEHSYVNKKMVKLNGVLEYGGFLFLFQLGSMSLIIYSIL